MNHDLFVTATDTEVGKTTISAGLLQMLKNHQEEVVFWKPVQTGTIIGDDTHDVMELTELPAEAFVEPCYRFTDPVAPWVAAKRWKKQIDLQVLLQTATRERERGKKLLIEGAGGLLVPLNEQATMLDLINMLEIPALVVAKDCLGTINSTLLTLKALSDKNIPVMGVVLTHCVGESLGNIECIEHFGKVKVLATLDKTNDRKKTVAAVACDPQLRRIFGVPPLPQ